MSLDRQIIALFCLAELCALTLAFTLGLLAAELLAKRKRVTPATSHGRAPSKAGS